MHLVNELTLSSKVPSAQHVEELLLMALTDRAGRTKQQSMLSSYMIWLYQYNDGYTCPDRFQHACVHVKYALKCTAFRHMQNFKKATEDKTFIEVNFKDTDCAFQEIEFMKKLARRCYCYVKPEKIRWLNNGKMQVNTKGTTWATVELVQIKDMITRQLDIVEGIFSTLGIAVISSEEMQTVTDADNIAIGHGLWTLNKQLRTPFVPVRDAREFLMYDTKLGVALGFMSSYSGGGAMRVPEVNEISFTRLTSGSVRSLRFTNGRLGGRCAITYDYTKMDKLMGAAAASNVQTTMKFTFERLSQLLLTHSIRFKPQAISVAMQLFGQRGAMCHGSMLVVEAGERMSDDSLRYHFNDIIEESLPGLSVASLRHVIEAVSLQAADRTHPKSQAREDMRQAMIALSAHSAMTSDGHYAGDQFQLAGIPGFHVEKYHRAALAFNTYIGLELETKAESTDDLMHAALAWIQEFRPEVAAAALHAVQRTILGTPAKIVGENLGKGIDVMSQGDTQLKAASSSNDPEQEADAKQRRSKNCDAPSPKRLRMDMSQGSTAPLVSSQSCHQEPESQSKQIDETIKSLPQLHIAVRDHGQCDRACTDAVPIRQAPTAAVVKLAQLPATLAQGHCSTSSALTISAAQPTGTQQLQLRPVQSETLGRMASIRGRIRGARILIVQACSTGKSVYFTHFAKQKNTVVILAQPFVSLKNQTKTEAITSNISTNIQRGVPMKQMAKTEGLLIISSYEKLHTLVPPPSPPTPPPLLISNSDRRLT